MALLNSLTISIKMVLTHQHYKDLHVYRTSIVGSHGAGLVSFVHIPYIVTLLDVGSVIAYH